MPDSVLRVLTCGSVDDGKSTLIGRLLFECGTIPDDVLAALERDSRRFGTVGRCVDYALLVDGLEAEREQGVTIDVAYSFFETPCRRFILADTPGHQQYTRNMVTGASTADLAILLVDARKGLLITDAPTRCHRLLLGVRQVVLAINKMDLVGFRSGGVRQHRGRFRSTSGRLEDFVRHRDSDLRPRRRQCHRVPVAGCRGIAGPTLLAALENAEPGGRTSGHQFRFPVQYVNRPDQSFRGYAGTIVIGNNPGGRQTGERRLATKAKVARIVTMDGDLEEAGTGEPVTLVLDREIDISRGDVLAAEPVADCGRRDR